MTDGRLVTNDTSSLSAVECKVVDMMYYEEQNKLLTDTKEQILNYMQNIASRVHRLENQVQRISNAVDSARGGNNSGAGSSEPIIEADTTLSDKMLQALVKFLEVNETKESIPKNITQLDLERHEHIMREKVHTANRYLSIEQLKTLKKDGDKQLNKAYKAADNDETVKQHIGQLRTIWNSLLVME
jgi:hypothetical protein